MANRRASSSYQEGKVNHYPSSPATTIRLKPSHRRFAGFINLDHLAGTRRDELSRLFVRMRGHAGEVPVSRAYVHLFKAM